MSEPDQVEKMQTPRQGKQRSGDIDVDEQPNPRTRRSHRDHDHDPQAHPHPRDYEVHDREMP